MVLTQRQVQLVRESFAALRAEIQPRSIEFYDNFFRRAPELRVMFRDDDIGGQGMRFMSTLATVVDNLEHPEFMASRFADLGAAHRAMGVKAAHFAPMAAALFDTIAEIQGEAFTEETRQAWEAAFGEVARTIIEKGGISKT